MEQKLGVLLRRNIKQLRQDNHKRRISQFTKDM